MNNLPPKLLSGYRDFMSHRYSEDAQRYRTLASQGQKPETMVIACCDSRAAPETIFSAAPGELFVARTVANLVSPYTPDDHCNATAAALEFAVMGLQVKNIVVLGHSGCGGVKAALDTAREPLAPEDSIGRWMRPLAKAANSVCSDVNLAVRERQTTLEHMSIARSVENLRAFPQIATRYSQGRLALFGIWFDIATGDLWIMDDESGTFQRPDIRGYQD